ncbi:hypothetical protein TSUD_117390 [Trifolium subterraneum]|nr:hypothetical protein TSUD_117390 [Trifolium subterraneum]
MEPRSENNDTPIDVVVSSLSLTEETTETVTSPSPLPTLPFDLIAEILCRLPVKLLLQFQSLISDPNFAKNHLRKSTPRHHLLTKFSFPNSLRKRCGAPSVFCSCDGILGLIGSKGSLVLWNPSIRKFKIFPTLNNTQDRRVASIYSFGYDHFTNNYKIVAVTPSLNQVCVYTLGTHSWRRIQDFPHCRSSGRYRLGIFVSGTVNWVTSYDDASGSSSSPCDIVSLDLAKETYQRLSLPDSKMNSWCLGVLQDCLCISASSFSDIFLEVWVMKEFGNKESWTKLCTVSYMSELGCYAVAKPLYIYEDNKLLMDFYMDGSTKLKLGFYDSKNEILCRLPVKLLLQLRCICKSWNSLISDPKFATKHLHMSKTSQHSQHLFINASSRLTNLIPRDCQIRAVFSSRSTSVVRKSKISFPDILKNVSANHLRLCSCNSILCFSTEVDTLAGHSVVLWNPSIRKFNVFPPLENQDKGIFVCTFSFGYDHFTNTYKIVAVSSFYEKKPNQVSVYTLGSNSWRRIQDLISNVEVFPSHNTPGVFASGTINWVTRDALGRHIVSLDLEKESYRKISKPNMETNRWTLGSLRDCLCIFATTKMYVDVWIMKTYENEESWTKLYHIPHCRDLEIGFCYDEALYI